MEGQTKMGLLDMLSQQAGCMFLSDLHAEQMQRSLAKLLPEIDASKYPAAEWNEAVQYILGEPVQFTCAEEAKTYLEQALSNAG